MNVTRIFPIENRNGRFSNMRMHLQPTPPIPITYATAAIPASAPFGTEYTPEQRVKIIGSRCVLIPQSITSIPRFPPETLTEKTDPAIAPTKPIQHVTALDNSKSQHQNISRFDTTYRTEYTNRIRNHVSNQDYYTKPTRQFKNALNQYPVLPPISANNNRTETSDRKSVTDGQQQQQQPFNDQVVPSNETMPPLNFNNDREYYDQQQQQQQQQQPLMNNEDTYLPEEPVLLTDYEEERLTEQIRSQLGGTAAVDRLKLLYQELAAYDPNMTGYVHYSNIQLLTYQLGLYMADDTLRFAMCKFVSLDRQRGFVNYEDLIRYFGKCLSSISPNQYDNQQQQQQQQQRQERNSPQKPIRPSGNQFSNDNDQFDPDERQIRVLLKQNLKQFDLSGTIDFDKLTHELNNVDRNQSGVLNRQQIEEVVYKVRIPFQRSLIYQILEKHCRVSPKLYDWKSFVRYLQEQIFDIKQIQDRSSPVYAQYVPSRNQWLDELQREFNEKNRLRIIDRFTSNNEGLRLESTHPTAWFTRFLRLANAMYTHRRSSNISQDFVLPKEEARRLFRAYNHIWDLKIDENAMQKVFEACSRNGHVVIDEALKQLAK
ncbi:unnamed protein product [Rotaria sordida]|uniref:Uncharacterized protein n=2 Tax=Rotaria sordida TaxID=392033 RepID=A0A818SKU0_9BILA|nr:unnamed protein product [Rotaria sordida]